MKASIKEELNAYVSDLINEAVLTDNNRDDWHYLAFNEDYYIIGYYQASEWLKKHDLDPWEAIGFCQTWEVENGMMPPRQYGNSEETVNMLAYIYGEEIINEYDL